MKHFLRVSVNLLPSFARHWVRRIPLVAEFQRWVVQRVISGEPFVHRINAGAAKGLRIEITLPGDKALWAGTFEPEFSGVIRSGVNPGDVCYDIGGYRGYMAGILALAGASRVIVFEPLPENILALKTLAGLNPELPLQIEQCAVGSIDGKIGFRIMPDRSMGKIASSRFQPDAIAAEDIQVRIAKLDTLVSQNKLPPPSVLKIDVEGAEVDVLDGAARTLQQFTPRIFLEAHSGLLAQECASRLRALGYTIRQLESDDIAPEQTRHLAAQPT